MKLEAFDWSVIVAGKWNKAILTPSGIGRLIYGIGEAEAIPVEIPLDGIAPYRVSHPSSPVFVQVESTRLRLALVKMTWDSLAQAMSFGVTALKTLPMTPVGAAGINVDFRIAEPPEEFLGYTESNVDSRLNDLGLVIAQRGITRSLSMDPGVLNVRFVSGEQGCIIRFNFHCSSEEHEALESWLQKPIKDISDQVTSILEKLALTWSVSEE